MPEEVTLAFIGQQLERILTEQRSMRLELRILREQVRIQTTMITRLDDTLTMNVLNRLQALEDK